MAEFDSEKDDIAKSIEEIEQWERNIEDGIKYLSQRGARQIYDHRTMNRDRQTWAQGGIIRDCQERSHAHGGTVTDSISDAEEQKTRDAEIVRRLRGNDWPEHMYSDEEVLKAHEGTLTLDSMRLGMSWRRFAGEFKRLVIVIVDRVRLRVGW